MKVFSRATGETLLIGRCDIDDSEVDFYDVPLFGPKEIRMERFGIGEIAFYGQGVYRVEKGVLLVPGQDASLLPGWQPLSS
jgi:hypothetical protein